MPSRVHYRPQRQKFICILFLLYAMICPACAITSSSSLDTMLRIIPHCHSQLDLTFLEELAYHEQEPYLTSLALSLPNYHPDSAVAIQGKYYLYFDQTYHVCRALRSDPSKSKILFKLPYMADSETPLNCHFEQTPHTTYLRIFGGMNRVDTFFRITQGKLYYLRNMTITEFAPDCRFGVLHVLPPGTKLYWSDNLDTPLLPFSLENESSMLYGWHGYSQKNGELSCGQSHDFYWLDDKLYLLAIDQSKDCDHSKIYQADIQSSETTLVLDHSADSFYLASDERLYYRDCNALYQTTLSNPSHSICISHNLPPSWLDERDFKLYYGDAILSLPTTQPYTVNGEHLYYIDVNQHLYRDQQAQPLFSEAKVRSLKTEDAYTIILLEQSAHNALSMVVYDQYGQMIFQETNIVDNWNMSRAKLFYTVNDQLHVVSLQKKYLQNR